MELQKHHAKTDKFVSIKRFHSLTNEDKLVSFSFRRDRKADDPCYNKPKYTTAQSESWLDIFKDHRICVDDGSEISTNRPDGLTFKKVEYDCSKFSLKNSFAGQPF